MIVHLIDGTYELFRQFYGRRHFTKGEDQPFGAVAGVLHSVLEMIEEGATHVGVATDHVIESFRNQLWPDYKTGEGIEPTLLAHFPANVLGDSRALALLFKQLATLRTDAPLFRDVDELEWRGPTDGFAAYVPHLGDSRLLERSLQA